MAYRAVMICDSVTDFGARLSTMELTYPRFVHSEFMTHRLFSRNAASSRAIPIERMIERIRHDPVSPIWWGKNQAGMQANQELDPDRRRLSQEFWDDAREDAIHQALRLADLGLHKQIVNRLLEPFAWITVIVSGTQPASGPGAWSNFFALRCHPSAQPELRTIADDANRAYYASQPEPRAWLEWHLPYVTPDERLSLPPETLQKLAVARCARVSYLTHDGQHDPEADLRLYARLRDANPPHASPFEHVATPALTTSYRSGNFVGWIQLRKSLPGECT